MNFFCLYWQTTIENLVQLYRAMAKNYASLLFWRGISPVLAGGTAVDFLISY